MLKRWALVFMLLVAGISRAQIAAVTVQTTAQAVVPCDYLGFSIEWASAESVMGKTATGTNTVFRQLLNNLTAYGSCPIPIRVGGGSTDTLAGSAPFSVQEFKELYQALGDKFTLGIPFGTTTLTQQKSIAATYYGGMPTGSLDGFEAGNEPDLSYGWTGATYQTNIANFISGVQASTATSLHLMFPSCFQQYCASGYYPAAIIAQNYAAASAISTHAYPGVCCSLAADFLLSTSAYAPISSIRATILAAHGMGVPYRVGEFQSVGSSGQSAVSNGFQASLWALKTLFSYAADQADGVNLHGNWLTGAGAGSANCSGYVDCYSPAIFTVNSGTPNTFTLNAVWPVYYGLLAFQSAAPYGASVYRTTVTGSASATVTAFDAVDASNVERMVIVNLDESATGAVNVTPLTTHTSASVCYLSASSYSATTGITICGQTFDGSTNGTIQGTKSTSSVTPSSGVYAITMGTVQGAIVTFQ